MVFQQVARHEMWQCVAQCNGRQQSSQGFYNPA